MALPALRHETERRGRRRRELDSCNMATGTSYVPWRHGWSITGMLKHAGMVVLHLTEVDLRGIPLGTASSRIHRFVARC
jgi:hypothetical protein